MGRCLVELNCGLMHSCLRVRESDAPVSTWGFASMLALILAFEAEDFALPQLPSRLLCRNIVREDQAENRQWD